MSIMLQPADILTKRLRNPRFQTITSNLRIDNIYSSIRGGVFGKCIIGRIKDILVIYFSHIIDNISFHCS